MRLYLVRHGETYWNCQNRIQGWIEVGLTERGRTQIRSLREHFPDRPFWMAVSTLRRAQESAAILEQCLSIEKRWNLKEFRELNQGHWNGMCSKQLRAIDGRRFRRWEKDPLGNQPPGGESIEEVRERVHKGLLFLQQQADDDPLIVVAHKVVNSLIAHLAGEWGLHEVMTSLPSNAAVYEVEFQELPSPRNVAASRDPLDSP